MSYPLQIPVRSPLATALALCMFVPSVWAAETPATADTDKPTDLDKVEVVGQRYLPDYIARQTRSATRTDTRLIDVPQAITVITSELIKDQAMTGIADLVRYMPGIGIAQGEGNRDTPVFRGNSSTADFFVDGMRDDVQYIRDVYNIERVEALKGPNAMIFGRGGGGGVINRVTRQADGHSHHSGNLQLGSGNRRRGTVDIGDALTTSAAFRVNAMYEDSESFRDGFELRRYAINPSFGLDLGEHSRLQLSYEHFKDDRVADRGVPSFGERPVATDPATFFGDPAQSPVHARVDAFDATFEHDFGEGLSLRNHLRWADYDKSYQNVFPSGTDASGQVVTLSAYNATTTRSNVFNQTDLVWNATTGAVRHTMLVGAEFGRQETDNVRQTGYFDSVGVDVDRITVPLVNPRTTLPVSFRQKASDADNHGVARVAAVYLQDQIEFSPRWQAILGLRYDDFRMDLRNNRTGEMLQSRDGLLSPRAGLVYKPADAVSLYASYSVSYQPRAGEQLASLKAGNAALEPETFHNRELGAKWDIRPDLAATIAVYRLDRGNVAVTDPADPSRSLLVDGQVAKGIELGLAGRITQAWQLMGGYAYQAGEITTTQSASALAGNRLAQLPRHSFSLWNRYDFNRTFGAGVGVIHRGAIFASVDNAVTLPAFTRFDAALYWTLDASLQLQLNVENLGNKRYFASANSNSNISPGAPRSAWISINYSF